MLTASEFLMREPLPLHRVHEAIFEFCRDREDVVVFGAQAVNVYVPEPRMSQDVDLLSAHPAGTAEALARALHDALHVATRVREVKAGKGYRVFEPRKDGSRHFADVRLAELPLSGAHVSTLGGIRYVALPVLAALKIAALARRRQTPKGATDLADLRRLLLAHPELRDAKVDGVIDRIGGGAEAKQAWAELLAQPLVADDSNEGY